MRDKITGWFGNLKSALTEGNATEEPSGGTVGSSGLNAAADGGEMGVASGSGYGSSSAATCVNGVAEAEGSSSGGNGDSDKALVTVHHSTQHSTPHPTPDATAASVASDVPLGIPSYVNPKYEEKWQQVERARVHPPPRVFRLSAL